MAATAAQIGRFGDRVPIDVFIVSPNPRLRAGTPGEAGLPRWNVLEAGSGAGALELLRKHASEDGVLLLDPSLPDLEPDEFHGIVRDRFPHTQIMMLNSHTGQLLVGSASPTPVSESS